MGEDIKTKAELYGPFWLNTSLVIFLFTFGNLSNLQAKTF